MADEQRYLMQYKAMARGAIRLLLANSLIDPNSKDNKGRTPLSWAAERGTGAIIRLLLASNQRVDAESKDISGCTPLSYAAGHGHKAWLIYC